MTDNIFIDTNILVYAHDTTAGEKYTRARDLFLELWENRNGCLSIQVLQEFYLTVTQKVSSPMDYSKAVGIIRSLSYWHVHEPRTGDIVRAVELQHRYQVAFWDAMIIQSAAQLGCRMIWSEDLDPGQDYAGVKALNPLKG